MGEKDDLIQQLEERHQRLVNKIANLPPQAWEEIWLGEWTLSQMLAHMSGWFREMTPAFARVARGERPTPDGVDYTAVNTWNAEFAEQAKSGPAALADFERDYAAYLAAAKALPEQYYGIDPERNRPRVGNRILESSGTGHFDEHQAHLEQWLDLRSGN